MLQFTRNAAESFKLGKPARVQEEQPDEERVQPTDGDELSFGEAAFSKTKLFVHFILRNNEVLKNETPTLPLAVWRLLLITDDDNTMKC